MKSDSCLTCAFEGFMRAVFDRFWKYIYGANGLVLVLYFVFVFVTTLFFYDNLLPFLPLMTVAFIPLAVVISHFLIKFISKLNIKEKSASEDKSSTVLKCLLYLAPLVVYLINFWAFYPGGFSVDSVVQYNQAMTNEYNDWHPVLQTLFAFKLPLAISGGWIGSIVLFQIICFSGALGYAFNTVLKYSNVKITVASVLFVLLNPLIALTLMFPYKDNAFATGAVLLTAFSVRIFFSKGEWIKSNLNTVIFIVTAVCTTLFRHNALMFTVPLVIAVCFFINRKRFLVIATSIIILFALIKIPFFAMLGVEKPDNRQAETLGLPLNVIAATVTYTPEKADSEILDFAYSINLRESYEKYYTYGCFDNVKYSGDTAPIEEAGRQKVLSMALRCLKASPKESLKSIFRLTGETYNPVHKYISLPLIRPYIISNLNGIEFAGNEEIMTLLLAYAMLVVDYLPQVFFIVGTMHLLMILALLSKTKLNCLKDWKKILLVLPFYFYNYSTAILLTDVYDSIRFFAYTYCLVPLLLVLLFKQFEDSKNIING